MLQPINHFPFYCPVLMITIARKKICHPSKNATHQIVVRHMELQLQGTLYYGCPISTDQIVSSHLVFFVNGTDNIQTQ